MFIQELLNNQPISGIEGSVTLTIEWYFCIYTYDIEADIPEEFSLQISIASV